MAKTYTITLEFEVKMTSSGYPMSMPSLSHPGEPAEGPEFEIESCTIEGEKDSIEKLYKRYKEGKKAIGVKPELLSTFDEFFANHLYDKVLDLANEDDWSDEYDDYDPSP